MKISQRMKEELRRFLLKKTREQEERVTITAAHKLSKEELQAVQKLIPDLKGTVIDLVVDESLMGGITVQKGSKIIDLSLKGRLHELEQRTYEIT